MTSTLRTIPPRWGYVHIVTQEADDADGLWRCGYLAVPVAWATNMESAAARATAFAYALHETDVRVGVTRPGAVNAFGFRYRVDALFPMLEGETKEAALQTLASLLMELLEEARSA